MTISRAKTTELLDYTVYGRPTDLAGARELARRDKYQFQWWAAWRLGSQTYREDKGADRGIDGTIYFYNGPFSLGRIIASVKGGDHVGVQMVRDLRGVIEREEAEMGIMVTLAEPTKPMLTEAASAGVVGKSEMLLPFAGDIDIRNEEGVHIDPRFRRFG